MIDWIVSMFTEATAELILLAICVCGGLVSGMSLLFGGDADMDADADGGLDVDDVSADGGASGPGVLSLRGMALLATGFGGVGFIVQHYTGNLLLACTAGLLSGWLFAFVGLAFVRVFFQQQASSLLTTGQITGATGIVTTPIPDGGHGEVRINVGGQQISRPAASAEGTPVAADTLVEVVRTVGGIVVVKAAGAEKEG